jgi:hypothetical protein
MPSFGARSGRPLRVDETIGARPERKHRASWLLRLPPTVALDRT